MFSMVQSPGYWSAVGSLVKSCTHFALMCINSVWHCIIIIPDVYSFSASQLPGCIIATDLLLPPAPSTNVI